MANIGLDFLQQPVKFHFPTKGGGENGPFCIIFCNQFHAKGPAFDKVAQLAVASSTAFKMPSRAIIQPTFAVAAAGAPPPAKGPSPPISTTFSKAMLKTYDSWIGLDAVFNDFGTPADKDHYGYMVLNLSRANQSSLVTFNLTYTSDGAFSGPFELFIATYRKATAVAFQHDILPPGFHSKEGLDISTPSGASFLGDTDGFFDPPAFAVHSEQRVLSAPTAIKAWTVAVSPSTLSLSVSG